MKTRLDTENLNDRIAQYYIKSGITPRVLEDAMKRGRMGKLAEKHGAIAADLTALADRWGIVRGDNNA
jgi:hypothetical protein